MARSSKNAESEKAKSAGFRDEVGRMTNATVAQYSLEPACALKANDTRRRAVASLAPLNCDLHFTALTERFKSPLEGANASGRQSRQLIVETDDEDIVILCLRNAIVGPRQ
jgi:hypothetical protein